MANQKKIGFYGGTFDPIHFGHLNLAYELMEKHLLDEVWFCPAQCNPLKAESQPVLAAHRLHMLQMALSVDPRFKIIDLEMARTGPSYTIDTLQELLALHSGQENGFQFYLLLGEDALESFHNWHLVEEIVRLVPLLIGTRSYCKLEEKPIPLHKNIEEAIKIGLTPTRVIDISSSDVRFRLKVGLPCWHLVPLKVLDYIFKHRLYYIPYEKNDQ